MQYLTFQPGTIEEYPILSSTKLILTDDVDSNMVQDIILDDLLPKASSIVGTKIKLSLVIQAIVNDVAYWDLIFTFPEGYPTGLLEYVYDQAIELDGTWDHIQMKGSQVYKLSFKAG